MNLNPNTTEALKIIKTNFDVFGFGATFRNVVGYLLSSDPKDKFDKKYLTNTTNHIAYSDLGFNLEQRDAGKGYSPTPTKVIKHVLKTVRRIVGNDFSEHSFVDLGSGLGRALMLAAQHPFKKVEGVELSESLVKQALDNVALFKQKIRLKSEIVISNSDVMTYNFPDGDLLIFMYDPFKEQLLTEVLQGLHETYKQNPKRNIHIAYVRSFSAFSVLNFTEHLLLLQHYQTISLDFSWSLYKVID